MAKDRSIRLVPDPAGHIEGLGYPASRHAKTNTLDTATERNHTSLEIALGHVLINSAFQRREYLIRDVGVGMDLLNIVVILKDIYERHHLASRLHVAGHLHVGNHGDLC